MNISGLVVGAATFFLIGIFHVVVIKTEYYCTKRVWPVFLALGLILLFVSLWIPYTELSVLTAILGISFLWSIKELFEQEKRVEKGWFPQNPNRVDSGKTSGLSIDSVQQSIGL